jgi:leucyl/phenylalanyl-tRNA---protein transferase
VDILYLDPNDAVPFPDPRQAPAEGLLAVGGDLSMERLLLAYDSGVFPWYSEFEIPLWWSPDPRAILYEPHISRSLMRSLRRQDYRLTWNEAFVDVVEECSRERIDGTWILPEMKVAYQQLHEAGHAHSLEIWDEEGQLIGGIYGMQRGALFAAESKFHRRRDASKIALLACHRGLMRAGIELFDVQIMTPHLRSLGVVDVDRREYLEHLAVVRNKKVDLSELRSSDFAPL